MVELTIKEQMNLKGGDMWYIHDYTTGDDYECEYRSEYDRIIARLKRTGHAYDVTYAS